MSSNAPENTRNLQSPPPKKKSLKRSASVASLLTPPRTRRDRERRRSSRSSTLSDDSCEEERPDNEREVNKKRRKLDVDDEEAFWMDGGDAGSSKTEKHCVTSDNDEDEEQDEDPFKSPSPDLAPHLLRKSQALASGASSLASPPPSRRRPVTKEHASKAEEEEQEKETKAKTLEASSPPPSLALPLTPQMTRKRLEKKGLLLARDSPENPFLDDGTNDSLPDDLPRVEEKPTMTYVFRGKKTEFANPYYVPPDRTTKLDKGPAPYELPVEHPDYSPDMRCPPRRLFAKSRTIAPLPKRASLVPTVLLGEDEDEDDSLELGPSIARRLFETPKAKVKKTSTLASR